MVEPHVADKIEPGAILYSSWGYDQTNVDYYMVTRTTAKSCWIVPMFHSETPEAGYSPMAGFTMPLEPQTHSEWCECKHRTGAHGTVLNMAGPDYTHCRGAYGEECDCRELRLEPIKPEMHRIRKGYKGQDCVSLTSYSSAWLWDGVRKYASHYA